MTEEEWFACDNRQPMLEHFRDRFSNRKLRLFACACCRHVWPFLTPESHAALETAERFADGAAGAAALELARESAHAAARSAEDEAVVLATHPDAWSAALDAASSAAGRKRFLIWPGRNEFDGERLMAEHQHFADVLRDIFGNPFRPVTFAPEWGTGTVLALAREMYASRDFSAMPILADALQDAGCEHPDVLAHCREPNQIHVRGCWVVDQVLRNE